MSTWYCDRCTNDIGTNMIGSHGWARLRLRIKYGSTIKRRLCDRCTKELLGWFAAVKR